MKKLLLISLLSLFFIGCGSYNYSSYYQIKDILAVTQDGDTIAVPIREFERQKYENYTRFNYNNTWYWNNWRYDYPWRYNYWYTNPGQYVPQVIITPSKKRNVTRLPRVNDRPKPGVTSPLPPRPPRTKAGTRPMISRPNNIPNTRVRTTPNVIQRNNTTRGSSGGSRSSGKGKPID